MKKEEKPTYDGPKISKIWGYDEPTWVSVTALLVCLSFFVTLFVLDYYGVIGEDHCNRTPTESNGK